MCFVPCGFWLGLFMLWCLSLWLQQHTGSLPAALVLDGKFIRDTVGFVCSADHETGVLRDFSAGQLREVRPTMARLM